MSTGCCGRDFAVGFFAGAFLGAVGALLMAPMAGSRFRQELSREARELSNRLSAAAENLKDKSAEVYGLAEVSSDAGQNLEKAAQSLAG
jgi:gas vesicle protein